ncbi:MAG: thiol peroxidase [Candidatus Hydrothermales bacterium]
MNKVFLRGNPLTLEGELPKINQRAPYFVALDESFSPKSLEDFKGKIKIISSVPSLDTPVCSNETKKISELMKKFSSKDYIFITISMDLPFAQKRWCGLHEADNVITLSDFKEKSFGKNYGVLIKENGLLARCVFIIDKNNNIKYIQLVKEITNEPDYLDIEKNLTEIIY